VHTLVLIEKHTHTHTQKIRGCIFTSYVELKPRVVEEKLFKIKLKIDRVNK
jgi:hypothetical protein